MVKEKRIKGATIFSNAIEGATDPENGAFRRAPEPCEDPYNFVSISEAGNVLICGAPTAEVLARALGAEPLTVATIRYFRRPEEVFAGAVD